eukprot:364041-Chlamydomonas_euryale.AAC.7
MDVWMCGGRGVSVAMACRVAQWHVGVCVCGATLTRLSKVCAFLKTGSLSLSWAGSEREDARCVPRKAMVGRGWRKGKPAALGQAERGRHAGHMKAHRAAGGQDGRHGGKQGGMRACRAAWGQAGRHEGLQGSMGACRAA